MAAIPSMAFGMHWFGKNEWSEHTFTATKNEETGEKTYIGNYPVDAPKGFVKVKTYFWSLNKNIDSKDVHITVDRHAKQLIVVTAVLAQKTAAAVDEHGKDYQKDGYFWTPWVTDTVKHWEYLFKAVAKAKLRGNNRLMVVIREPGHYHIMLPDDADAEIKAKVGNIDYISKLPTQLHIESKTVNKWGDNGSSTSEGQKWDYYWADHFSPQSTETKLIAKAGHINVP